MSQSATAHSPAAGHAGKRDRTHMLYIAVIVAVVLGVVVGLVAPDFGKSLAPLGTAFVNLIKMMISPVIFCTIVLGIGSIRQASKVGKVGGLALLYFIVMSTVALIIGLVVGNILHPGSGLAISAAGRAAAQSAATSAPGSTTDFLLGIIPTTLVSPLVGPSVLSTLFVALLIGFAIQALGSSGQAVLRGIKHFERVVFRVLSMVMWVAPIGAFGAIAGVVGGDGMVRVGRPGPDHAGLLHHMLPLRRDRARRASEVRGRAQHLLAVEVPGPRVPDHRLDLVVGGGAAATGRQDGAHRRLAARSRHHGAHRLLVQPRRDRDLPDDGVAVHRRCAGQAAGVGRADLPAACS